MRTVNQRGSALMLVPAGVLILLMLGALSIDTAAAYYEQRQLDDAATSLANRVANQAVDLDLFYQSNGTQLQLDPDIAADFVNAEQQAFHEPLLSDVTFTPVVTATGVTITVTATAHRLIASALPTSLGETSVAAQEHVDLVRHG